MQIWIWNIMKINTNTNTQTLKLNSCWIRLSGTIVRFNSGNLVFQYDLVSVSGRTFYSKTRTIKMSTPFMEFNTARHTKKTDNTTHYLYVQILWMRFITMCKMKLLVDWPSSSLECVSPRTKVTWTTTTIKMTMNSMGKRERVEKRANEKKLYV